MQCVHGPIFVLRLCVVRVWASSLCSAADKSAPSLCSDCVSCVWVPALCSGCGQKVHPRCAQTFFSFFFFLPAACMQHRGVDEKQKKCAPFAPFFGERRRSELNRGCCKCPSDISLPKMNTHKTSLMYTSSFVCIGRLKYICFHKKHTDFLVMKCTAPLPRDSTMK